MLTMLLATLMTAASGHGPTEAMRTDFDLSDLPTLSAQAEDQGRFRVGEIEGLDDDTPRARLRLRGAKVKLRVPIG